MTDMNDNTQSAKWDGLYSKGAAYKPLSLLFLKTILEKAKDMTGKQPEIALDLGCGTGDSVSKLKQAGIKRVIGTDCSAVAIKDAKHILPDSELSQMDLNELKESALAQKKFDFIICKLTLAFIKDRPGFIETVKGMMGESSAFCIITPILHEWVEYTKEDKPGIAVPYSELISMLDASFSQVVEFHHDYFGDSGDTVTFIAKK